MKVTKIKNRVTALTSVIILTTGLSVQSFSFDVKAEALPEIMNASCTLADMVMSYCASSGIAIMNETVINSLYETVGSSFGTISTFVQDGLLTYTDGSFVDTGLSTQIANVADDIVGFDISTVFNQTAEQSATGTAVSGFASLAAIAGSVASSGYLPIVAGVAIEGFASFQLGTCIANLLGLYEKPIAYGFNVNDYEQLDKIPSAVYGVFGDIKNGVTSLKFFPEGNIRTGYYKVGSDGIYQVDYNPDLAGSLHLYMSKSDVNNGEPYSFSWVNFYHDEFNKEKIDTINTSAVYFPMLGYYDSLNDFNNFYNNLGNGSEDFGIPYSPDLIGANGNIKPVQDNNGNLTTPDVLPSVDPSTQRVNPGALSLEDWLRFANDAKGNTGAGQLPDNGNIFNNIIDALRSLIPGGDNPGPGTDPGGETYPVPGPVPDTTPVPDPEYQPETKPQPQYTEKPTENETDITSGDPWTTPDLLDKFPFCIPRDVYRVFTKLDSGSRAAPHIQWRFHPNEMIDYTFDIDFAEWDSIAVLLRALELLGFIVALAVATRKMILS